MRTTREIAEEIFIRLAGDITNHRKTADLVCMAIDRAKAFTDRMQKEADKSDTEQ